MLPIINFIIILTLYEKLVIIHVVFVFLSVTFLGYFLELLNWFPSSMI